MQNECLGSKPVYVNTSHLPREVSDGRTMIWVHFPHCIVMIARAIPGALLFETSPLQMALSELAGFGGFSSLF